MLLTMFNMGMLGDFDRDVFQSDLSLVLFVAFIMIVVIVMLNVLIAIVSDSYDYGMVRSRKLFNRSRLEFAAEVEQVLKPPPQSRTFGDAAAQLVRQITRNLSRAFFRLFELTIYRPLSYATKHVYGEAAANRTKPAHFMRTTPQSADAEEDDDEDTWDGRVLDLERRTKVLLRPVQETTDKLRRELDETKVLLRPVQETTDKLSTRLEKLDESMQQVIHMLQGLHKQRDEC